MSETPRILFIDDESLLCTMAEEYLELQGYEVDTFMDSFEALAAFADEPERYAVIVSDQSMPGIAGLDLLIKIGEIRSGIPRILCTGYGDPLEFVNKNDAGIDAFFMKPYSFDELLGQIQKLV